MPKYVIIFHSINWELCTQMRKFILSNKKRVYLITIMTCVMLFCTGCSNKEREEEQRQLRINGITFMENGKYEEALEEFQSALELSLGKVGKEEIDICFYKAEAQYRTGDVEGAMETYTSIIDFNESVEAYFLRGNLYYSLGEEENALKDYSAAIEKEPQEYDLYMGIYETLMTHGKKKQAQEYLNHALEIKGDSAFDKMQKGRINFILGENDTAITLLEEAAEGKEVQALYYLAEAYTKAGNEEAAKQSMRAYMETGVSDSYELFQIAQEELGNDNYVMALECLTTALEMDKVPNKQIIMRNLVMVYEELYDFATAKEVLEEYVKEYPDDEEAKRELTFLETRVLEEESEGN